MAGVAVAATLLATVALVAFGQRHDGSPHMVVLTSAVAAGLLGAAAWGPVVGLVLGLVVVVVVLLRLGRPRWRASPIVPRRSCRAGTWLVLRVAGRPSARQSC